MRLYILGICGTFMAGVARLAKTLGNDVGGCDQGVYPPMSEQLEQAGIAIDTGFYPEHLQRFRPDVVVVGNAMSRGTPIVEAMLDQRMTYTSGPQWLAEHVLQTRRVIAVAGTHGKTTTASMCAHALDRLGRDVGFLIGGVPRNFGVSARLGTDSLFVIEADEYDTAFFDKRSKFVHYRPEVAILNNLEYDHADIFPDLASIETQFHHLIRTIPGTGRIVRRAGSEPLDRVLDRGRWTPVTSFGFEPDNTDASYKLRRREEGWRLCSSNGAFDFALTLAGAHNALNAAAATAALAHFGIGEADSLNQLASFDSVTRRLEEKGSRNGVRIVDDFAHHPTAIAATLTALRETTLGKLLAAFDPRTNTMRKGVWNTELAAAFSSADEVFLHAPAEVPWVSGFAQQHSFRAFDQIEALLAAIREHARSGDTVVFLSHGGFGGAVGRFLNA